MRLTLHIGLALILVILLASPPGADAAVLDGLKRVTGNAWELFGSLTRAKVPANLPENPSTLHNTPAVGTVLPDANAPLRVSPTREEVAGRLPLNPGSHVIEQDVDSVNSLQQGSSKSELLQGVRDVLLRQKGEQTTFNVRTAYQKLGLRETDFAAYKQLSRAANERIAAVRLKLIGAYTDENLRNLVIGRARAEEELMTAIGSWTAGSDARAKMFRSLAQLHDSLMGHGIHQGRRTALEMRSTELRVALDLSTAAASIDNLQPATRQWYLRMAVKIVEREQRKLNRMHDAAKSAGVYSEEGVEDFLQKRFADVRYLTKVVRDSIKNSGFSFDEAGPRKLPRIKS